MKFKKGDLVEMIKKDSFGGNDFPVGSVWELAEPPLLGVLVVYDSRNEDGKAILFKDRVKKIEHIKPRFKIGDMVRVRSSIYSNDNSIGKVYEVENIKTRSLGSEGIVYLRTGVNNDYTKLWIYRFYEVELVDVNKNYQHELEELTQAYELLKSNNKKLEKELREEKKRAHKFFEHANKRFEIIQEQFKEIDSLKEENQKLITKVSRLEAVRINYAQRVSDLIAENEILKEDLERKKALKNFLTRKKG